ncbi:MAG: hypothetical protein II062_00160 [Oscillospiraceae bacterium]|nr:hypothetical protein [Oscillospiraceae bacterium]
MNLWNLAVGTAELMLCALCVIQILTLRTLDRRARVCLLCFCCCMLPFVGGNLVGQLLRGKPGAFIHGVLLAANCCEFLFSAGLAYIGARYLLALQKLRFGDDLNVVYELECESFSLPTLTLQPLVENAISHGIRRTESGRGTVAIRTRELEDRWELSVADDGAGFDPGQAASGAGSHVALSNVRSRLARVCGGSLLIESSPGKGTTATIRIPRTDGPKKS